MSDALVSAPVATVAGVVATALIFVASNRVAKIKRDDIIPLMGVMGAFVFAAQMINFSIPGTGSSGHIIGGVLLAALVGPWAAFLTLCSVIIIQCLIFADGGLMSLGCNILNMAAVSCLVAYPLLYAPIARNKHKTALIFLASIIACTIGLEFGALLVTAETELSGVTALPVKSFLMFMLPIHLAIGLCEGVATALVLSFVNAYKPDILYSRDEQYWKSQNPYKITKKTKRLLWGFAIAAVVLAGCFTWLASTNPDGLEWSVDHVAGQLSGNYNTSPIAVMPDYNSTFAGLFGSLIVLSFIWGICYLIFKKRHVKT